MIIVMMIMMKIRRSWRREKANDGVNANGGTSYPATFEVTRNKLNHRWCLRHCFIFVQYVLTVLWAAAANMIRETVLVICQIGSILLQASSSNVKQLHCHIMAALRHADSKLTLQQLHQ